MLPHPHPQRTPVITGSQNLWSYNPCLSTPMNGLQGDSRVHRAEISWNYTVHLNARLGASQIKGFRPLLDKTFPSIYRIFRASQNTKR